MEIEKLATSAIEDIMSKTDYIDPCINSGDKEPSWDGYLDVYSNGSKKKEFFKGKALVQVKGKRCTQFSEEEIRYQVKVSDLKNYRIEGGTLYFVVQINDLGEKKIFYNALLPYEINKLLENVGSKKSISVKMYVFPTDKNEVTNIVYNFLRDKESQVLIRDGRFLSVEEMIKQFGADKLKFTFTYTGLGYDRNRPHEYLFNHDIYLYAQHTDLNIKIPIDHMWRADICKTELEGTVKVGEKIFYDKYDVIHKRDGDELHIGKSIIFVINNGSNPILKYNLKGDLSERIVAETMMVELIKNEVLFINGIKLEINPSQDERKKFDVEKMESHVKHLTEINEVLELLGVKERLDCSNLGEKDEEYIRMLIAAIKYNHAIGFNNMKVPPIATVDIGNLKIMLSFKPQADGRYRISNYSDCDIDVMAECSDGSKFPTSKYTILVADDFASVSNMDIGLIVDEMMTMDNSSHLSRVVLTLLEMIKAYDIKKNTQLLEEATRLAKWLCEKEESDISMVNLYQCYFRKRELSDEEKVVLDKIVENNQENIAIKAAACILLKDTRKANRYINKLSSEELTVFKGYPIYSLL